MVSPWAGTFRGSRPWSAESAPDDPAHRLVGVGGDLADVAHSGHLVLQLGRVLLSLLVVLGAALLERRTCQRVQRLRHGCSELAAHTFPDPVPLLLTALRRL